MKKIIYNLRKKSVEERIQILNILSIFSGIILVMLWIWSLNLNISAMNVDIDEIKENLKPLSSIKENFIEGYRSINP